MGTEVFQLAILLSLKDAASRDVDSFTVKLRGMGKEGRETLKTIEGLRSEMKRGLGLAGVGVAGLMAMRGGVKVAGDFEAAMADLRLSIQEVGTDGKVDLAKLGDEMNRFEKLGMDLGNRLPGTTRDFIEMFSTLKQGGLGTEAILKGTGEAVAHLAVVTGQVPRDLAEPFAQYAQQFKLTGEEAITLADVLARLKFRAGLSPQELIEGSKFFQLRAGAPLGLKGLEGAEISGRLLASLRKQGLEGGIGGRELGGMFSELALKSKEQKKALAELSREGINLQFIDDKKGFLGIENVFVQLEKLRKLGTAQRLDILGRLFGGTERAAPANLMIEMGLKGWRDVNAEIDKGAKLNDMIATKTATFNTKLESLQGTAENLVATTFTPMLDTLKPVLDTTNEIIGSIQGWAKENQGIASTATHLFGLGSATLLVVGGFRAMRAGWALWRITSAIGAADGTLPEYFKRTGDEAGKAGTRVGGYGRQLKGIPAAVGTTVTLLLATETISYIMRLRKEAEDAWENAKGASAGAAKSLLDLKSKSPESFLKIAPIQIEQTLANELKSGGVLGRTLLGRDWLSSFFEDLVNKRGREVTLRESVRERFPELRAPAAFPFFKRAVEQQPIAAEKKQMLLNAAIEAFPSAFREFDEAMKASAQGSKTELEKLMGSAKGASTVLSSDLSNSALAAAASLRDVANQRPQLSVPGLFAESHRQVFAQQAFGIPVPSRQMGGEVQAEGMVNVHPGERIVPARVTRGLRESSERGGDTHIHITINVPPGSSAADNPRLLAALIANEVRKQKERK